MSNSTVIGTTSSFYGVATFQSQPIITSTILANNDNSTNIATTAWANSFLTYAQTQPNTWTGAQTFTTANVSVLNVSTAIVNTINASSITSDMTIGANLNGGSLTIGNVNSVTNITSGTINASIFKLYSGVIDGKQSIWLDTIQSNLTPNMHIGFNNASQIFIGSSKTITIGIGGDSGTVNIAASGLVAGARVNIGTGANNVGNSQVTIGSSTLSTVLLNGVNVVMNDQTGSKVQIGGKDMGVMYLRGATIFINDGNNSDYINNGNTIIGNSYGTGFSYIKGSTVGIGDDRGDIYIGSNDPVPGKTSKLYIRTPIRPQYLISFTSDQIGYSSNTPYGGSFVNGVNNVNQISVSTLQGVWMITARGNLYAQVAFNGITAYNMELGYYGGAIISRNYVSGSSFTYNNTYQTLAMVYSSGGSANSGGLNFYSAISLTCGSISGASTWDMVVYYTRIA